MNLRRRHKEGAEVSTESLNDIMFFLLLFFLILSTLVNPNAIKVNLPSSKPGQPPIAIKPVPITVTKDHQYYIQNVLTPLSGLEAGIANAVKDMKEPAIILHIDNSLSVQDLVDVMQIGAKLKVKMVLGTKPSNA